MKREREIERNRKIKSLPDTVEDGQESRLEGVLEHGEGSGRERERERERETERERGCLCITARKWRNDPRE